jgi:hypothetical protein
MAGTEFDLDVELEAAGIESLLNTLARIEGNDND